MTTSSPSQAISERVLQIERVSPEEIRAAEERRRSPLPPGIALEVAAIANDVLSQIRPNAFRPRIVVRGPTLDIALEPDQTVFPDGMLEAAPAGFEIARGRTGARLVRRGPARVTRNGWPIPAEVPVAIGDGDRVVCGDTELVVTYEPAPPRSFVEVGGVRASGDSLEDPERFAFRLEPAGGTVQLALDGAVCRSIVDVVCDGDGRRSFDPTPLSEIERAILDWTLHKTANLCAQRLLDGRASLQPMEPEGEPTPSSRFAVRIGRYVGTGTIAVTPRALALVADSLGWSVTMSARSHPSLESIGVSLSVHARIGRIAAAALAAVEPGDCFVARDVAWPALGVALSMPGFLRVQGSAAAAPAMLLIRDGTLEAAIPTGTGGPGMKSIDSSGHETAEPFASVLEILEVTATVELARRRVPLGELLQLGEGDAVSFGTPLSAEVTLYIDGTMFARGELVEIDGAVGVRVKSIGGRR